MAGSAHLRRTPTQQRSRERVDRILDTAAAIVGAEGIDGLKVSEIARQAGVPLGTVYQFFARKDDIVYALAERFVASFEEVLTGVLTQQDAVPHWRELVDLLLDTYAEHYRSQPALRELWIDARFDPEFLGADHEQNNTRFAATVAALMAEHALVDEQQLTLMVYVTWEACQALLETAFRADPDGDAAIIEQTKVLAVRYLAPAFEAGA